eukprot:3725056-Amphidinium_carterae.2
MTPSTCTQAGRISSPGLKLLQALCPPPPGGFAFACCPAAFTAAFAFALPAAASSSSAVQAGPGDTRLALHFPLAPALLEVGLRGLRSQAWATRMPCRASPPGQPSLAPDMNAKGKPVAGQALWFGPRPGPQLSWPSIA